MLEELTVDTFADRIGQEFGVQAEGAAPLHMVLESVTRIPVAGWRPEEAAGHRQPFSLVFLGPPEVVQPQAIYRFEHVELGAFEIFIVPIGRSARGVSYEAVFS
jgi:uncharacterized protein DUF6916